MEITKGEASISESGNPAFDICIVAEDGGSICHITKWPDAEANAKLITEAFNVANETGYSPRELADINAELLEACKSLLSCIDSGMDVMESMDKGHQAIQKSTKQQLST